MPEIMTIGETMIRMVPLSRGSLQYVEMFQKKSGGAESNFAVGVVRLGHSASWISRVGDDPFGKYIVSILRGEGVDVSGVKFSKGRPTGLFFNEWKQADNRRNRYYRQNSAASFMSIEDVDLEQLATAKILHLTGITPALSESCREMVFFALKAAAEHGVKVSFDPNMRFKLWRGNEARKTLLQITEQVDILLLGEEEAAFILGDAEIEKLAGSFHQRGPSVVVIRREDGAFAADEHGGHWVPGFPVREVVDPAGAGDAFDAGFVAGQLEGWDIIRSTRLANAVGALTVTTPGNIEAFPTREEVLDFMEGKDEPAR
jgi:2-dehydro-3-deoxygluconokinase